MACIGKLISLPNRSEMSVRTTQPSTSLISNDSAAFTLSFPALVMWFVGTFLAVKLKDTSTSAVA